MAHEPFHLTPEALIRRPPALSVHEERLPNTYALLLLIAGQWLGLVPGDPAATQGVLDRSLRPR